MDRKNLLLSAALGIPAAHRTKFLAANAVHVGRFLYVSPAGDDVAGDGSWNAPFKTFDKAFSLQACMVFADGYFKVPTVRIPKRCVVWGSGQGTPHDGRFGGCVIEALDDNSNCVEMNGDHSGLFNVMTTGASKTWHAIGVLVRGFMHNVQHCAHQNLDGSATLTTGGDGIRCTHTEGSIVKNFLHQECRYGMHWGREVASSTFEDISGSRCTRDFWGDGGADPYGSGAMPQSCTITRYKCVAGKPLGDGYRSLDASIVMDEDSLNPGRYATNITFNQLDANETVAGSLFPVATGKLLLQNSTLNQCVTSPEMGLEVGGIGNVIDGFYNQYQLIVSGTQHHVRDLKNVGSLRAPYFGITGTQVRYSVLRNVSGGKVVVAAGNMEDKFVANT